MSDIVQKLFYMAMEKLPYTDNPKLNRLEEELEQRLDRDGNALLREYEEIWIDKSREDARRVFYTALALGIELGALRVS